MGRISGIKSHEILIIKSHKILCKKCSNNTSFEIYVTKVLSQLVWVTLRLFIIGYLW